MSRSENDRLMSECPYQQGITSFLRAECDCPYPAESAEFAAWWQGFDDAREDYEVMTAA